MSGLNKPSSTNEAPQPRREEAAAGNSGHEDRRPDAPGYDPSRSTTRRGGLLGLIVSQDMPIVPVEIDTFNKAVERGLDQRFGSQGLKFSIRNLPSVPSVYVVRVETKHKAYAYLMGFTQLINSELTQYTPASDKLSTAAGILLNADEHLSIVGQRLITPDDLSMKGELNLRVVLDALSTYVNPVDYTLRDISEDLNLEVISSDLDRIRAFIEQRNPSTVKSRIDIGFMISVRVPRDVFDNMSDEERALVVEYNMVERSMPVMAVGAYVDFIGPRQINEGRREVYEQYVPRINITAQEMLADSPLFTLMGMLAIKDLWTSRNGWMDHFLSSRCDVTIANLYSREDDETKLDDMPAKEFLARNVNSFSNAVVTYDVGVGRKTSNFLFQLASSGDETDTTIVREAERVIGDSRHVLTSYLGSLKGDYRGVARSVGRQFQGFILERGQVVDSRNLDYLTATKRFGILEEVPSEALRSLTFRPVQRLEAIESLYGGPANFKSMYDTNIIVITNEFLDAVAASFREMRVTVNDRDGDRRRRTVDSVMAASSLSALAWGDRDSGFFGQSRRDSRGDDRGDWFGGIRR